MSLFSSSDSVLSVETTRYCLDLQPILSGAAKTVVEDDFSELPMCGLLGSSVIFAAIATIGAVRSGGERRERRSTVHARVSTFEGPLDRIDEGLRYMREEILPTAFQEDEGFKGALALADRQSGKMLTITFWESEEAMHATEEEANRLRSDIAQAGGETIAAVERYEVGLFELES